MSYKYWVFGISLTTIPQNHTEVSFPHLQLPAWFDKFYFFANYIAFANSAFNPIIYTGFNENFKRGKYHNFQLSQNKHFFLRVAS